MDIGDGVKPPGFYVQRECGLFPAPRPQDSADMERVQNLFMFMGFFFAKCIQDSRIVDIPLSRPFLKLMCSGDVVDNISQNYRQLTRLDSVDDTPDLSPRSLDEEEEDKELILDPPKPRQQGATPSTPAWYAGLLSQDDFMLVNPHRARFLNQLRQLVAKKQAILSDVTASEEQRLNRLHNLTLENPPVKLEDLAYVNLLSLFQDKCKVII